MKPISNSRIRHSVSMTLLSVFVVACSDKQTESTDTSNSRFSKAEYAIQT